MSTFIESPNKKVVLKLEDIQYMIYVETLYNDREKNHVVITLANEFLPDRTVSVYALKKDHDKVLLPWFNNLKKLLETRDILGEKS